MLNITLLVISSYILLLDSPFYNFKSFKHNRSASLFEKKKEVHFESFFVN